LWNLGLSVVEPDSAFAAKVERTYRPIDTLKSFAQFTTPSQFAVVQKAVLAVESNKEADSLSLEERQQIRGLMFASLDKSSPLSKWISLAPSLLSIHYHCNTDSDLSRLTELCSALFSLSVRDLSIFDCDPSFDWGLFHKIPSLRSSHFDFDFRNRSNITGNSKVLAHLLIPYEDESKVRQHTFVEHEWKRANAAEEFALTDVYAHPMELTGKPTSNPLPLLKWTETLAMIIRSTPSLVEVTALWTASWVMQVRPNSDLIDNCDLGYHSARLASSLSAIIPTCPALADLDAVKNGEESFSHFLRQLSSPTILRRLEIEDEFDNTEWKDFVAVFPNLRLSSLALLLHDHYSLKRFGLALPALKTTLTDLNLSAAPQYNPKVDWLAHGLSQLDHLQSLNLEFPLGNTSKACNILLPALVQLPLADLTLSASFDSQSMQILASQLPHFTKLRWFGLLCEVDSDDDYRKPFTPDDWRAFFSALPPTLISLYLRCDEDFGFGSSLELLPKTSLTLLEVEDQQFCPNQFGDLQKALPGKQPEEPRG
jgi:hypothetical protein